MSAKRMLHRREHAGGRCRLWAESAKEDLAVPGGKPSFARVQRMTAMGPENEPAALEPTNADMRSCGVSLNLTEAGRSPSVHRK